MPPIVDSYHSATVICNLDELKSKNKKIDQMKSYKPITLLLLVLSSLVLMNFQCNDCEDVLHDRFFFSVIPNSTQNTFKIGDTLILTTSFSAQIELEFSGEVYDNSNQIVDYRLEIFEGLRDKVDTRQARDNFEFINVKGAVTFPPSRTWEILIENNCDENLCEMEFGMIPKKTGYYGIALRSGGFGYENDCQYLTLMPSGLETNGNNNFEIFEDLKLSEIRVNRAYFKNPENERLLYFFKVDE